MGWRRCCLRSDKFTLESNVRLGSVAFFSPASLVKVCPSTGQRTITLRLKTACRWDEEDAAEVQLKLFKLKFIKLKLILTISNYFKLDNDDRSSKHCFSFLNQRFSSKRYIYLRPVVVITCSSLILVRLFITTEWIVLNVTLAGFFSITLHDDIDWLLWGHMTDNHTFLTLTGVQRGGKGERRAREAREDRTREDRGRGRLQGRYCFLHSAL